MRFSEPGSLHAVVDAIAHIDVKTPWLTKERFVAGGAAAVAVAGGVVLGEYADLTDAQVTALKENGIATNYTPTSKEAFRFNTVIASWKAAYDFQK